MSIPSTGEATPHQERRYWGRYRGVVMNNLDPLRLGRVKCRVPEILGLEITTDWAAISAGTYGGQADSGFFAPPDIGAAVFVEFESGDVNRPLVVGTWWGQPTGTPPETPSLARNDGQKCWKTDPSTMSPKGDDKFKSAACTDECQPGSPLRTKGPPQYPYNKVFKTKNNGITIEVDDTPGLGRVHIWHGPSKSWVEIDSTGELSIRVAGKSYRLVEMDDRHHVKMNQHTLVELDHTVKVGKDRWLEVAAKETRQLKGTRDTFVTGQEQRVNQAALDGWVTGQEQRVNQGGLKHWAVGDRTDVVLGNYTLWVMGNMTTNVFGNYSRQALGTIEDKALAISHKMGAPTGSPPTQPTAPQPPVCPGQPSCPPIPPDTACPDIPSP